jgi:hypothetical protein
MPVAIFGLYDFLNFNGKLFSQKTRNAFYLRYPAPPSAQTVIGASYRGRSAILASARPVDSMKLNAIC